MENNETNHLLIGIAVGAIVVYVYTKMNTPAVAIAAATTPNPVPATPATVTTSDYGTQVIVANNGQLNTIVGYRSPAMLSYQDFNTLIADPNKVLATYQVSDLAMEDDRAWSFLNQIGWLDIYEKYEQELPSPSVNDMIMFALNLGAGFRLLPPTPIVATTTANSTTPPVAATT